MDGYKHTEPETWHSAHSWDTPINRLPSYLTYFLQINLNVILLTRWPSEMLFLRFTPTFSYVFLRSRIRHKAQPTNANQNRFIHNKKCTQNWNSAVLAYFASLGVMLTRCPYK